MTRTVVEFLDITTQDGWRDEDGEHQPLLLTAMGKVIEDDDHIIVLAPMYGPKRVGYLISIPKGCIVTRTDF